MASFLYLNSDVCLVDSYDNLRLSRDNGSAYFVITESILTDFL